MWYLTTTRWQKFKHWFGYHSWMPMTNQTQMNMKIDEAGDDYVYTIKSSDLVPHVVCNYCPVCRTYKTIELDFNIDILKHGFKVVYSEGSDS